MKKFILLLLALLILVPVIGMTACGECEHSWAAATCTSPKTCTKCQATEGAALGHTPVDVAEVPPTCVVPGASASTKCSVCGVVVTPPDTIPATGKHEYADTWTATADGHYHVCKNCPATDTKLAHIDADKNGVCDVCNGTGEDIPVFNTVTLKTYFTNKFGSSLVEVGKIQVETGKAMTEKQVAELAAARYLGYGFKGWYTTFDAETGAYSNAFDPTAVVSSNVEIYGDRGDLAGENITWSHDATSKTLTLTGTGEMFDFANIDAVPWYNAKEEKSLDIENVVIDERITTIGSYSFYVKELDSTGMRLSSVVLHEGITQIGAYAFYGESRLTEVEFPESLETINAHAFRACMGLTYIDIGGENLDFVGESAFAQCEGAQYVVFNGAIEGSGNVFESGKFTHAYFAGNKGQFESVEIGFGNLQLNVAYLFYYADYEPTKAGPYWYRNDDGTPAQWCYALYYLPSNGKKEAIEKDYVFVKDPKITAANIEFRNNIWYKGYQFEGWGSAPFTEGTVITGDTKYTATRGGKVGDGVDYNITDNVLTISGSGKMWNFEEVTAAPWNEISNFDNTAITEIVIGANVTYIGDYAFCDFPNLESVEIKANIVEMSTKSFYGCANLKYIFYYGNELEALNCKGLNYQEEVAKLTVYCQELENEAVSYLTAKGIVPTIRYWKDIELVPAVLGEDGAVITPAVTTRVTWEFVDGVLTVGGEGAIPNVATDAKTPWANTFYWIDLEESLDFDAINVAVTKIVVREGVTEIGDNAFAGISAAAEIELPMGLKRISATAFAGTAFMADETKYDESGLLIINNNLIKVKADVVGETVLLPTSLATIADGAFEGCTQVKAIRLPKTLAGATEKSYEGLDALTTIFFNGTEIDLNNNATKDVIPASAQVYFFSNRAPTTCGYFWKGLNNPTIYEDLLPVNPENGIHNYEDGVCTQCGTVCEHTEYESGVCKECGAAEPTTENTPEA